MPIFSPLRISKPKFEIGIAVSFETEIRKLFQFTQSIGFIELEFHRNLSLPAVRFTTCTTCSH